MTKTDILFFNYTKDVKNQKSVNHSTFNTKGEDKLILLEAIFGVDDFQLFLNDR